MNIGKHLLKGSVVSTVALVAQVVMAFVITPVLLHSLGERTYGIWLLLMSLIGYYAFFDFGISSSVARFVASAAGRNDEEEIHAVVNTALVLFLLIGAGCLLVTLALALLAGHLTPNPAEVPVVRACVLIVGSLVAVGFPVRIFQGVLKAWLRYDLIALAGLAKLFTANILIWIFLRAGYGIVCLAVITALAGVLEYLLTICFARRAFPALRLGRRFCRASTRGSLLSYSWRSFVLAVTQQIRFKLDAVVISSVLSVNLVAHYSIGARFMEYFVELVGNLVGGQLMPVFSRYQGRGQHDLVRDRFLSATRVSTVIAVFFGASLVFYGGAFIRRWMGPGFEDSTAILLILAGPFTLALAQTPGVGLLYGMSKHHLLAWVCAGAAVVNLTLSLLLAKTHGMYGVALGTAIELTLNFLFVFPIIVCRVAKAPLRAFFADALFGPAVKCLLPLGLYFFVARHFLEPAYLRIGVLALGQGLVFVPAVFFGVLRKDERELLLGALRRVRPAPGGEAAP